MKKHRAWGGNSQGTRCAQWAAGDATVYRWAETDCPECLKLRAVPTTTPSGRAAAAVDPVIHVYNYHNKAVCGATWNRDQNYTWSNGTCRDCLQIGVAQPNRYATARYAELFGSAKSETARYPHKCPRCSAAAYVGFTTIECSKRCA